MMTDRADDMKAELREGDGPLEQAPPPKPILSARLSSSPTNVAPAALALLSLVLQRASPPLVLV